MKLSISWLLVFLLALLIPVHSFAATTVDRDNFSVYAHIISYVNVALEITSAICIKQFFFPGDTNRMGFHIFNFVFGVLFYAVALNFLIAAKSFYVGFELLSPSQCITRFFFGMGIYSVLQWLVITGMVINVFYVLKYRNV